MKTEEHVKIKFSRVLCGYGYMPFQIRFEGIKIKGAERHYNTLAELKNYYELKSVQKTPYKDFAISSRGKRYEFVIYSAFIDKKFLL